MLRDACCLCLNADFELTDKGIGLNAEKVPSEETLDEISASIAEMLKGFSLYFAKRIDYCAEITAKECFRNIKELFTKYYLDFCERLKYIDNLDDVMVPYSEKYFPKCLADLQSDVKHLYLEYDKLYKDARLEDCAITYPKKEANFFLKKSKKQINQAAKKALNAALLLDETRYFFGGYNSDSKKYYYLYLSIHLFCAYLKENGADAQNFARELDKISREIFEKLANQKMDVTKEFTMYLSHELEQGRIIQSRTGGQGQITGWFDEKRQLFYFPMERFYEDWVTRWKMSNSREFSYTKAEMLKQMLDAGVLLINQSQTKGNSVKYWWMIVVAPSGTGVQKKEKVIKMRIAPQRLSDMAQEKLKKFERTNVPRRSRSLPKE